MELTNQPHLNGRTTRRRLRKSSEMYPLVESWLESNQSQKAFCDQRGIKLHLLSYWARKYEQEKKEESSTQASALIPIQIQSNGAATCPYALEIIYPDGTRLGFGQMIELSLVRSLLFNR